MVIYRFLKRKKDQRGTQRGREEMGENQEPSQVRWFQTQRAVLRQKRILVQRYRNYQLKILKRMNEVIETLN